MSGFSDEVIAIQALQQGAQDYLVKGYVDNHQLLRSLRYAMERQRMQLQLQQQEQVLQQQLARDRLLTAVAHRIRRSLHLDEILQTTVAEVRQFLQTDRVMIYRFKTDSGSSTQESPAVLAAESLAPEWTIDAAVRKRHRIWLKATEGEWEQEALRVINDVRFGRRDTSIPSVNNRLTCCGKVGSTPLAKRSDVGSASRSSMRPTTRVATV